MFVIAKGNKGLEKRKGEQDDFGGSTTTQTKVLKGSKILQVLSMKDILN